MATRLEEMRTEYASLVADYCESLKGPGGAPSPTLNVIDSSQFHSIRSVSDSAPSEILEREDALIGEAREIDEKDPDVGAEAQLKQVFRVTAKQYAVKPNTGPEK